MYVLGLSSYAYDASAALIKDGRICSVLEQERLNREKHTWKFPKDAIDECLKMEGISFKDIERITFYWKPFNEITGNLKHFLRFFPASINLLKGVSGTQDLSFFKRLQLMQNIDQEIQKQYGVNAPKVEFIEHHMCHAGSCFFVSGFEESAILVVDGRGEYVSTTIAIGKNNKIEKLREIKVPHSLGHFYAAITDYLGFYPFFDEWKVMGMSAYGKDTYVKEFEDLIYFLGRGDYRLNLKYFNFHTHGQNKWLSDYFIKKFGPKRQKNAVYEQRHYDIAYALQRVIEKAGVYLADYVYAQTKIPNLCMAGGVVLNCLMNQQIVLQTPFKNFFMQPLANDGGGGLGSALYYYHQVLNQPRKYTFDNVYLGASFNNAQVEDVLKKYKLKYSRSDNIARDTAKKISQRKIVGWFQGRMEAGPRALGNRSIVVDPTDPEMKDKLNARVKRREGFRPFAPSILEEKVSEYFDMPKNQKSPYMILTGHVKTGKTEIIPAVTHADGTARVQTVSKNLNLRYWELIHEFEKLSGVPILLNTSFNENEPIVCTPEDAVKCFLKTEFDVLAIEDFLVQK